MYKVLGAYIVLLVPSRYKPFVLEGCLSTPHSRELSRVTAANTFALERRH